MSLNFGQQLFPSRNEPIVSYDFFDISDGVGYDIFYGVNFNDGSYGIVTSNQTFSENVTTSATVTEGETPTKYLDLVFDITFNVPKNIKGEIYINIPISARKVNGNDAGDSTTTFAKVRAYHYDGSTETIIGSEVTTDSVTTNTSVGDSSNSNAKVTLSQITASSIVHFKAGEILRFDIEIWGSEVDVGDGTVKVGHDPANRNPGITWDEDPTTETGAEQNTQMSFHVPFKLDI